MYTHHHTSHTLIGPLDAPTTLVPTTPAMEAQFLGNGEWPFQQAPSFSDPSSIPEPPQEGVDSGAKTVYKMSSNPRGLGELVGKNTP